MSFLERHSVLVLNSLWQILGLTTPKNAVISLSPSGDGKSPAKVIDVIYRQNPDGSYDLSEALNLIPMTLEEWFSVPIRQGLDQVIRSSKLAIRSPTIIITSYSKMPLKRFRPNKSVLYNLQNGVCGYTGKPVNFKKANIEHKIPKSKNGPETFENLMVVDKDINSERGNMPLEQFKYKPLFAHKEPRPIPAHYSVKQILHPDWKWLLN